MTPVLKCTLESTCKIVNQYVVHLFFVHRILSNKNYNNERLDLANAGPEPRHSELKSISTDVIH